MNNIISNTIKIIVINILLNNMAITKTYASHVNTTKPTNKVEESRNAIEINIGKFHLGPYAPYQIQKKRWNKCNTLYFCETEKLFGSVFGIKYIKRYFKSNKNNVDIDSSIILGSQNYKSTENDFAMLSIVPTYRRRLIYLDNKVQLGIGAGLNLAIGDIPFEGNDNTALNTQLNLEIGYRLKEKEKLDLTASIQHRCTLFGLIGGDFRGSQWYTVGIRKWL